MKTKHPITNRGEVIREGEVWSYILYISKEKLEKHLGHQGDVCFVKSRFNEWLSVHDRNAEGVAIEWLKPSFAAKVKSRAQKSKVLSEEEVEVQSSDLQVAAYGESLYIGSNSVVRMCTQNLNLS